MTIVFGLTGSIASGKSTVSSMLKDFDIPIIDADLIAREVVEPGELAYKKIVESFGEEILHKDLTINRKKLGNIIFSNAQKREALNQIVHPAIREEMQTRKNDYIQKGTKYVVLDIPLLFENQLMKEVDYTIVVYIPEEMQRERLIARDHLPEKEATQRIRAQMPIEEKKKRADFIIDNQGTMTETREQVKTLLKKWQKMKEKSIGYHEN